MKAFTTIVLVLSAIAALIAVYALGYTEATYKAIRLVTDYREQLYATEHDRDWYKKLWQETVTHQLRQEMQEQIDTLTLALPDSLRDCKWIRFVIQGDSSQKIQGRLLRRISAGGAGQPTNGGESPPQRTGEANGN